MYATATHSAPNATRPTLSLHSMQVAAAAQPATDDLQVLESTDLLRGRKTVEISHNGSTYRLQATRLGKLILTK